MKKKMMSLALALFVCISSTVCAFAATDTSIDYEQYSSTTILGGADSQPQTRVPNLLVVDWNASATQINIAVKNAGVDTVDTFGGTVTVEGGVSKTFQIINLLPLQTRQITVSINMQKCYEDITVWYYGLDGGVEFGQTTSHGHRELPSTLTSMWVRGNSANVYESINYHFKTHGAEVHSSTIYDYAQKALLYRNEVASDIQNLSTTDLNNKYTITSSSWATVSHKYKNKQNRQFAILSDSGYYIVSYGI